MSYGRWEIQVLQWLPSRPILRARRDGKTSVAGSSQGGRLTKGGCITGSASTDSETKGGGSIELALLLSDFFSLSLDLLQPWRGRETGSLSELRSFRPIGLIPTQPAVQPRKPQTVQSFCV